MAFPVLPQQALNPTFSQTQGQFPPNLAGTIPEDLLKEMSRDVYSDYVLPQMMERRAFEPLWNRLLDMYRIRLQRDSLRLKKSDQKLEDQIIEIMKGSNDVPISDSLIYDAVDRLKNLNHFISWKDGSPVQYNIPAYFNENKEDEFYFPLARKLNSANGLLRWNIDSQNVYRKHLILSGHHYLYGCCFNLSEYEFQTEPIQRRFNDGRVEAKPEITRMGVTFEPISIRKLWLNYRMSIYDMDNQPCPFFYEEMPRFAILQNQYDLNTNPFGHVNLDKLTAGQWLFSTQEAESARQALEKRIQDSNGDIGGLTELVKPEKSVEALWTLYPIVPYDPQTGEYKVRADGTQVPPQRFIWQIFSSTLAQGNLTPTRIQTNFYPNKKLPLYGSCHMPDLDSGAYGISIGEVLQNHYNEICKATNQFLANKDWINNPPSWYVIGSPCANHDRTKPGADIPVTGPQDFGWRQPYDATASTIEFLKITRDSAQTTSKAVDAILGKAMGSRTSATEASNAFQAAMSGATTDINIFNYDIMGGYAERVWDIVGLWFDPQLIRAITGQYGEPLTPEDLHCRVALKWDVGSTYIESIVKQGSLRYALESAVNSQVLNQSILWREFFTELKLPGLQEAVIDDGFAYEVERATEQACQTYLGEVINIDPAQNHQVALEVKIRFLQDLKSSWNTKYAALPSPAQGKSRVMYLQDQINLHQQFAILQMQQQAMQMQMQAAQAQKDAARGSSKSPPSERSPEPPQRAGQIAQTQQA